MVHAGIVYNCTVGTPRGNAAAPFSGYAGLDCPSHNFMPVGQTENSSSTSKLLMSMKKISISGELGLCSANKAIVLV